HLDPAHRARRGQPRRLTPGHLQPPPPRPWRGPHLDLIHAQDRSGRPGELWARGAEAGAACPAGRLNAPRPQAAVGYTGWPNCGCGRGFDYRRLRRPAEPAPLLTADSGGTMVVSWGYYLPSRACPALCGVTSRA